MEKMYNVKRNKPAKPANFFEKIFLDQKLNNVVGYLFAGIIALGFGYLIAEKTLVGLEVFAGIFGFFIVMTCMLSTEAGFYITMVFSFFVFAINRYLFGGDLQVGIIIDVLVYATFLSLIIKRTNLRKNFKEFTRSVIVIAILLYTLYLFIQVANPYAQSFDGWFQTFRRFLLYVLLLFISYNVFTDYAAIKRFVIVLFILCVIAGVYGCIQQWHGFFDFELAVIHKGLQVVYINGGELRKFSSMSDPMSYGVIMAACSLFFLIIALNQKKPLTKWVLIGGSIFMILGMAYSGTRTANVMFVAGIGMYILLTIDKKITQRFAIAATLIFVFLLYVPIYNNGTLNRFRTSFLGGGDASFNVREVNREFIQPYIYSHPIGGGLCTTGEPGKRYNPGHYLAGFPPDSSYLRKALETGWIGLAFIFLIYFITLRYAIHGFFSTKKEKRKVLYAASACFLLSFYIAEFPQEALGQLTDMVIYYPIIAILIKLRTLDNEENNMETLKP